MVNVAPGGSPVAVREVIACPSRSTALTVNDMGMPTIPEAVVGAVTIGARSVRSVTVMKVVAVAVSEFQAVKVTA